MWQFNLANELKSFSSNDFFFFLLQDSIRSHRLFEKVFEKKIFHFIKCCMFFFFFVLSEKKFLSNFNFFFAGCECIIFSSTFAKEYGTFSSPDYPKPYHNNINCLLYTFIASRDEIIEITFQDFDIQKSHLQ